MPSDSGLELGSILTPTKETAVESGVGTFRTVVPPVDIKGCFEETLPTTNALGIQSYQEYT